MRAYFAPGTVLPPNVTHSACCFVGLCRTFFVSAAPETQKRERKRRGRAAQEARVAKKEAKLEQDRADRIAAMRAFTVDLQVTPPRCNRDCAGAR